jgi:hypothetical protein
MIDLLQIVAAVICSVLAVAYMYWIVRFRRAVRAANEVCGVAERVIGRITDIDDFVTLLTALGHDRRGAIEIATLVSQLALTCRDLEDYGLTREGER